MLSIGWICVVLSVVVTMRRTYETCTRRFPEVRVDVVSLLFVSLLGASFMVGAAILYSISENSQMAVFMTQLCLGIGGCLLMWVYVRFQCQQHYDDRVNG